MEEYLQYLKTNQNGRHTHLTTLDRCNAHLYLKNLPTINLHTHIYTHNHDEYDIPVDQHLETTLTVAHHENSSEKTISTILTPVNEKIHFTYKIAENLILNGDGLMIEGMKWLAEQALKKENYPEQHPLTETLTKTLTLFQLHHRIYTSQYGTFYTQQDLQLRIPLALTRMAVEKKLFLDINNKHTVQNILNPEEIPEEWFKQLNR